MELLQQSIKMASIQKIGKNLSLNVVEVPSCRLERTISNCLEFRCLGPFSPFKLFGLFLFCRKFFSATFAFFIFVQSFWVVFELNLRFIGYLGYFIYLNQFWAIFAA